MVSTSQLGLPTLCDTSATTASLLRATGPTWSRSSCCPCQRRPSFQWRTVLVRKRPLRTQNTCKHLGLTKMKLICMDWCHESVFCVCVDAKCGINFIFEAGSTFPKLNILLTLLGPPPFDNSEDKRYVRCPQHMENKGAKTQ